MTRKLPSNSEAEREVLGGMLVSEDVRASVSDLIHAEDFFYPRHVTIYRAILELFASRQVVSEQSVADLIARREQVDPRTLRVELLGFAEEFGTTGGAMAAGNIIATMARERRLIQAGIRISDLGYSRPVDIDLATSEALGIMLDATVNRTQSKTKLLADDLAADLEAIEVAYETGDAMVGIPTAFPTLDRLTSGWQPGQLVTVAAQTSMGKTSILLRMAAHAARLGKRVLFVSLEMTERQIRRRLYAQEARASLRGLINGQLDREEWGRVSKVAGEIAKWQFLLNDRRGLSMSDISAEAQRETAKRGHIDLVAVDYLQIVEARTRNPNRYEQVSEIARDLKNLAGILDCPVVTAAQLNDAPNQRTDKRPKLGDLRESKGIEHESDLVLFGYWPWRHDHKANEQNPRLYELIVAKHREGEPDVTIQCTFDARINLIREVDKKADAPPQPELAGVSQW